MRTMWPGFCREGIFIQAHGKSLRIILFNHIKNDPFKKNGIQKFKILNSPFNEFINFLNISICNKIMSLLMMNISNIDVHGHSVISEVGKQI